MKQAIYTPNAPEPIGPYSQAIVSNGFIFVSGQIPIDTTGEVIDSDISAQTKQVMRNISEILDKAGSSFEKVVKTTIYLKSIKDFSFVNDIYGTYFQELPPARTTIEVNRLPKDVLVEIDCIATV